jgi:tetratricopeptide (TPR) repeat protein
LWALAPCFAPCRATPSDAARWIEEARSAGARDDHAAAIDGYRRAIEEDPSLADSVAVLLGAQLTWAARYEEAITLFQSYLERYPRQIDAWKTLALAQSWDDRLDDALASYRRILALRPGDRDAAFGVARMLAWKGRLTRSLRAYDELLDREPAFRDAALGRAQVTNWRGDHRSAARLYTEILHDWPDDPAALEGRAAAWNWAGLADRARSDLERVTAIGALTDGGRDLARAIERAWSPAAIASADFSRDSDDFELLTLRGEGELPLAHRARLRAFVFRDFYEKPSHPDVEDLWAGISGEARLTDLLLVYGAGQALVEKPEGVTADHGAGDLHLALLPGDRVRIDAGYGRAAFFTYERTQDGTPRFVDADFVDMGVSFRPTWRTTLLLAGDQGWYSDDNHRVLLRVRVRQAVLFRPRLWLEAGGQWIDFDRDSGGGLWTPREFRSLLLAGETEWTARPWFVLFGRVDTGWARDIDTELDPYFTASAGARVEAGAWRLELRGGRADSNLETGRGYRRTFGGLLLRVGF